MGDDKWTFIEGVKNPRSCTIVVKGPNDHTIAMLKVTFSYFFLRCLGSRKRWLESC